MYDDIDYGALFGVEVSENEQEVAEPAEETTTETAQGENEQEAAEPAEEKIEPEQQEPGAEQPEEPAQQSPEERSKYAAARRKAEAERDAAIEKAKADAAEEARKLIDEAFSISGLINPYTKEPIKTKADYDAYKKRYDEEQKNRVLKKSGMTDDEFNKFVADLPEVKQAREAQAAAEEAARQAREAQAKVKLDEQIKSISVLDPTIKTVEDLTKMANYPKFYELVKKGNDLVDAFKLANYDALTSSAAAASRQAAINAAQSKQHLTPTAQRGQGAVSVPNDVKESYRMLMPGITDAEIQQHYSGYLKK